MIFKKFNFINGSYIFQKIYLLIFGFLGVGYFFPKPVWAQLPKLPTSQSGIKNSADVVEIQALGQVFANILTIATTLSGMTAFIFLMMGGYKWLTSGGDPKKLESAKSTFTYALLGLILLVLIWFILLFIEKFTGVKVTLFQIPSD